MQVSKCTSAGIRIRLTDIMRPATLHGVGVITKLYFAILWHLRNQWPWISLDFGISWIFTKTRVFELSVVEQIMALILFSLIQKTKPECDWRTDISAIGVGAQSTLGGKTFLPEKYVWKINKMPEFCMILAPKCSNFTIIIARKIFFLFFLGGGAAPSSPTPVISAVLLCSVCAV